MHLTRILSLASREGMRRASIRCFSATTFHELEHQNWQRGVEAYDAGFGALTRQTIPVLLETAGFPSGPEQHGVKDFLDVATGPGYVASAALTAAARVGASCRVTALDFSSEMLARARRNLGAQHPGAAVTFVEGDA